MNKLVLLLTIIGGLNWGSIGIFKVDLVGVLFGGQEALLSRIIFTVVGLSALWCISFLFNNNNIVEMRDSETRHTE